MNRFKKVQNNITAYKKPKLKIVDGYFFFIFFLFYNLKNSSTGLPLTYFIQWPQSFQSLTSSSDQGSFSLPASTLRPNCHRSKQYHTTKSSEQYLLSAGIEKGEQKHS